MEFNPRTYTWVAIYKDGGSLKQFDERGDETRFGDIDQTRLASFNLIPNDTALPPYHLHLAPWQRLIFFRRHIEDTKGRHSVLFFLGWQATIDGRNYRSVLMIGPDSVDVTENID